MNTFKIDQDYQKFSRFVKLNKISRNTNNNSVSGVPVVPYIYLIKLTYAFIYMLAIAGQTAGPNGLNFFEGILEYPRGKKMLSNLIFF